MTLAVVDTRGRPSSAPAAALAKDLAHRRR
jgi:hypothetical protein